MVAYVCLQRCVCVLSVIGRFTYLNLYVTPMLLRHTDNTQTHLCTHTYIEHCALL